ncbi:MAG: RNA polymerase sigma factor [Phycisphaerales bacterium]
MNPPFRERTSRADAGHPPGREGPAGGPAPGSTETDSDAGAELPALLAAAGSGDEDSWRRLIALYGRRVFALVKSRVRNEHVAEEITQSVFATVATKLSSGAYGEMGRFESWLFRIAMNRVRDEARRAKLRPAATDPETFEQGLRAAPAPPPTTDARQLKDLRDAMEDLPDSDRQVVELRHHAGMSFKHIADLLEEPLGTILARHHRALRKLKDILGGNPGGGSTEGRRD